MQKKKKKKKKSIKDYFDRFLRLCVVIPQPPHDIYLREAFRVQGLRTKVKMAIINMPPKKLVEVVELAIMIEK
jgi:hypothetical protein